MCFNLRLNGTIRMQMIYSVLLKRAIQMRIEEIFINYTNSREVYDRSTTITNIYFSTVIAEGFLNDLDPKTMAECKKRSDCNK
jgi:hypothetical protein